MKGPRFSAGDPLAGLPLRRALLIAAVAAVVLPLLVVTTALTGFAAVERSHAMSYRLLTAQQYQQDADLMYATIHSDVLESLEGFEGKLTTSKWAALTKSSQDTALRDIQQLVERGVLVREAARGRSTSYSLALR